MPKVLRLHTLPEDEKILRAPNAEVNFPLTVEIKELIEDMKLTVRKAPGIGLAAPQVGHNLMLAIIHLEEFGIESFALINPKVISRSIKKTALEEGCLSIPKVFGDVKRPAKVEVVGFTEDGRKVHLKGEKLFAKVLQHEIDHLNGILIQDKFEK
ncbi:MAG: peptide deformylase [Candidatus Doudnabacteria bacterium RIFCSPHIGHO2_02_FULL_48_21]|uniref:Peptide deformylase n=1 Tax=Candidatus Doudnabacteria bacterium RIFCSPLOWO2_02_FULL_48_13 TaxID=1817845 RepID=A0A1F5Q986_9BACT|nr:MAG: peptide deformylase [Candidatus Doudnabacteria bacterium RIFCSPHIGHO2_01_48_18]OGE79385.1 MAG: peptide deformylase [Candidatus Doudnabacteria bacterium RIFCSPHIGHO2_01_FULL_48_180]OGE91603.1 MAG: peptide deformylase [Candidatus Doudnabacteria bacterium RIFCSPHIGHO2_12_FULL_47_25]OGE93866.1 MAG: peptide deformylase [Candidatus Doudnabacteria bacterium RIFCSPHIGHO2_02_FULL_48_21]OGE97661.1 MAG: peptide deformylase [Candidatus Doudnabacteria bacterium RIFCSPLOWO2_01_FULL_48_57]OGE98370.1 